MRPRRMRVTRTGCTAVALALLAGCASETQTVRQEEARPGPRYRPGEMPVDIGESSEKDDRMTFQAGYLDQSNIDEVMERHTPDLIACFSHAGPARNFASGKVKLRFMVAGTGEVNEVRVEGSHVVRASFAVAGRSAAAEVTTPPGVIRRRPSRRRLR